MKLFVTGGAGYVGANLVPKLLNKGHQVKVLDLMMYGEDVFDTIADRRALSVIKGDLRNQNLLEQEIKGCDAVIHLACVSNDPSFDLNPQLGKSINLDSFRPLVEISKNAGIRRFIYASSSSVYGVKDVENVTEDMSLEPLTDYSKFKAMCEEILSEYDSPDFVTVSIRPATVCGFSTRQRFDLIVNILTNHAVNNRKIKVFGGTQKRPNIHIDDMTDLYVQVLDEPDSKIRNQIFNVGFENHSVDTLAEIVKNVVGTDVTVEHAPTDDPRSYHISSEKVQRVLGFKPKKKIQDAVVDLKKAFDRNAYTDPMNNKRYYNIKTMREINLM